MARPPRRPRRPSAVDVDVDVIGCLQCCRRRRLAGSGSQFVYLALRIRILLFSPSRFVRFLVSRFPQAGRAGAGASVAYEARSVKAAFCRPTGCVDEPHLRHTEARGHARGASEGRRSKQLSHVLVVTTTLCRCRS
eukprot:2560862-Pyramimonas_sp.AAC.1